MCKITEWCVCFTLRASAFTAVALSAVLAVIMAINALVTWHHISSYRHFRTEDDKEYSYISVAIAVLIMGAALCLLFTAITESNESLILIWLVGAMGLPFCPFAIQVPNSNDTLEFFVAVTFITSISLILGFMIYVWIGVLNYYWVLREKGVHKFFSRWPRASLQEF